MMPRQVTVGVDGSLVAVRALDRAADEAALRGAALNIVYAVPDMEVAGPVLATAVLRARRRRPGLTVTALAVPGSPVRALAHHSRNAELTVVGTRGLGALGALIAGSVSRRLAARTRGPLLVVRGAQGAPDGEVLFWPGGGTDADGAAFAFAEAERRGARLCVLRAEDSWYAKARRRAAVPGDGACRSPRGERPLSGVHDASPTGRGSSPRGRPVRELLEATRGAVVVVVGAQYRGCRPGSVARALLRHAHCPVVLVPGDAA
ncbi:universal stress protein [Streptomyces rhizosphaerihabitans]|uniref:universal stress protein n=1 Tax=Streptomyces rhizosphaerihabitans TaxID=1266770 RepID=UPI0021BF5BBE|nr:universal stress protein [Streptomyces rhizosphaerihabitans]MCT9011091.1 universal stress protein [Streptomyces rhizosphaerihabitans]